MTRTHIYILSIIMLLIVVSIFGLYIPFSGLMGHDMGCPFSFGSTSLCGAPLAHLSHWQFAFFAIILELLVVGVIAIVFTIFYPDAAGASRVKLRSSHILASPRPTLFQELFSRGILNRRAP